MLYDKEILTFGSLPDLQIVRIHTVASGKTDRSFGRLTR